MLLFDEYNSHTDFAVIDWCWKHHIVPITLSLHSTHFLQSLDVVCFQPFKHYHRQALDRALRLGIFDYNQLDFIADFSEMRKKIFKSFTVISSFVKTGLILYNSEKVLALLHEKLERLRSSTSSTFSFSIAST